MAVTGLAGLRAKLAALPGRCDEAAFEAAQKVAELTARRARERAPVDTGDLRESIEAAPEGRGAQVTAGSDHALFVELGTRRQAPHPFMAPAAGEAMGDYLRLTAEAAARRLKGG